jgi:hypothetical protein
VTIEYSVVLGQEAEFIEAIRKYARTRRRDGAYQWGIHRDTEAVCGDLPGPFVGRTSSFNTSARQKRILNLSNASPGTWIAIRRCDIFFTPIPQNHSHEPSFVAQSSNDAGGKPRLGWPEIPGRNVLSLCIQHHAAVVALLRRSADSQLSQCFIPLQCRHRPANRFR